VFPPGRRITYKATVRCRPFSEPGRAGTHPIQHPCRSRSRSDEGSRRPVRLLATSLGYAIRVTKGTQPDRRSTDASITSAATRDESMLGVAGEGWVDRRRRGRGRAGRGRRRCLRGATAPSCGRGRNAARGDGLLIRDRGRLCDWVSGGAVLHRPEREADAVPNPGYVLRCVPFHRCARSPRRKAGPVVGAGQLEGSPDHMRDLLCQAICDALEVDNFEARIRAVLTRSDLAHWVRIVGVLRCV